MTPATEPSDAALPLCCTLDAEPGAVRACLARLVAAPPLAGLPPGPRATAELALAEVLNNITEHAYANRPGLIRVSLQRSVAGLCCEIVDCGAGMPGGRLPGGRFPDLADLPEGGFGWGLIRALTQDLRYVRTAGENRLTFLIPL